MDKSCTPRAVSGQELHPTCTEWTRVASHLYEADMSCTPRVRSGHELHSTCTEWTRVALSMYGVDKSCATLLSTLCTRGKREPARMANNTLEANGRQTGLTFRDWIIVNGVSFSPLCNDRLTTGVRVRGNQTLHKIAHSSAATTTARLCLYFVCWYDVTSQILLGLSSDS